MPPLSPDELALLELSTEDAYALWEAASRIRTMHPSLAVADVTNRARTTIRALLDRGLIGLEYYQDLAPEGTEPPPDPKVAPAECLDEPLHWEVPVGYDFWWIRFVATQNGVAAYHDSWSA